MENLIKEISKLSLKEGDLLVLKGVGLDRQDITNIKEGLDKLLKINVGILTIPENYNIGIATPEVTLKVKKLVPEAVLPRKAHDTDAGFDLFLLPTEQHTIAPGEIIKCHTGIAFELPPGKFGMIRPRSSAFGIGLMVNGTLDENYRGECYVVINNIGNIPLLIEGGKAYAQMILVDYTPQVVVKEVNELSITDRGESGFGSSGNHSKG